MTRPWRVAVALAAAAIAVSGCGGGEEEANAEAEEDAREAAETYVQALKDGDAEAACEQLSEGALAQIRDQGGGDCAETLESVISAPQSREALGSLEVVDVNAAGSTATATIGGGPEEITNELVLEDGEWKLASPGGVGAEGPTAE